MKKINVICVLDMSGSMSNIIVEARKGFNKFLKEQKNSGEDIKFSLMFFDTNFYMPYKNVDIKKVKKVDETNYYPDGGTALYDALGFCIEDYIDQLGNTPLKKRADKTLFVILTDGEENASKMYDIEMVKFLVEEAREDYNAEFIYLGANQDACFVAESMGMSRDNAFTYAASGDGITVAYANISKATTSYVTTDIKNNLFQNES